MKKNWEKETVALIFGLAIILIVLIWEWPQFNNSNNNIPPSQTESSSTAIVATTTSTSTITTKTSTPVTTTTIISAPPPPATGHAIGIAAGGTLSKLSSSTLNQELNQMVALGVTWVRFDIEWGDVQYSSSSTAASTWGNYDMLMSALAAHHLHGLGLITYTPQWARTATCSNGVECPPADPSTFATFAAEVAARYKGDGMHDWEIWNEPNNASFWAPTTDCAAYTALLKVTYPAIKAADPDAVVVTGGMAPESTDGTNMAPTDFLNCIYANGGKGYFDAVGDHPYTFPSFPSDDNGGAWDQMSVTTPSLRSIMVANGDGNKKIWITEFGTPTDGPDPQWYVSEASETQMVADTIGLYKTYSWAGPLFWYTLDDSGTSTDTNENFFGLIRADGSTKPAYTELQSLISKGL